MDKLRGPGDPYDGILPTDAPLRTHPEPELTELALQPTIPANLDLGEAWTYKAFGTWKPRLDRLNAKWEALTETARAERIRFRDGLIADHRRTCRYLDALLSGRLGSPDCPFPYDEALPMTSIWSPPRALRMAYALVPLWLKRGALSETVYEQAGLLAQSRPTALSQAYEALRPVDGRPHLPWSVLAPLRVVPVLFDERGRPAGPDAITLGILMEIRAPLAELVAALEQSGTSAGSLLASRDMVGAAMASEVSFDEAPVESTSWLRGDGVLAWDLFQRVATNVEETLPQLRRTLDNLESAMADTKPAVARRGAAHLQTFRALAAALAKAINRHIRDRRAYARSKIGVYRTDVLGRVSMIISGVYLVHFTAADVKKSIAKRASRLP